MRFIRTAIITGVAAAALAGAAVAAKDDSRMMLVAMPDGSIEHVRFEGNIAPQLLLIRQPAPTEILEAAFGPASIFAEMDRVSASLEAHNDAMMRQAAMMQAQGPTANGGGIVMTNAQGEPVGVMQYSYVSSTTDANGCTQTISYSSDDAGVARQAASRQPKVIRTSSGSCGASQTTPRANTITPTAAPAPAAKPAPKIVPVSAPKPQDIFTPSRV